MSSKLFILLLLFGFLPAKAQLVETLVIGPSTFNDGLAIDSYGNIYASWYYSTTVTKIFRNGSTEIFAGGFSDPNGLAFGNDGFLYVPSAGDNRIDKVSPEGQVSLVLNTIVNPTGIVFDKTGNMIVCSYQQSKVFKYDTSGTLTDFLTGNSLNGPVGLKYDENENLYIGNFNDGKIIKRSPDGSTSVIGDIPGWLGFIEYANGYIYATAYQNNRVYRIKPDGSEQIIFAGTGFAGGKDGDLLSATFNGPNGIVASVSGDTLYISDYGTRSLRMITGVNSTIMSLEDKKSLYPKMNLEQNYPNRFNPSTTINFEISQKETVSLSVFSLSGQRIKTLLDGELKAGKYSVSFNANEDNLRLSSGVYIYRLQAGLSAISKQMILLK